MKKQDLRSQIIPTRLSNTDDRQKNGNREFDTTDLIYLDSYDDQFLGHRTDEERRVSATDFAKMNYAYVYDGYETRTGHQTTSVWLRSAWISFNVFCVHGDGGWDTYFTTSRRYALCPSLHYNLPSSISARSALGIFNRGRNRTEGEESELDIREVKDKNGRTIYHTLQIGEYPKTKVEEELSKKLEALYHGGRVREGLVPTGRWYTSNGQKENYKDFAGKHNPEFEYNGTKYVRVTSNPCNFDRTYSDGTLTGEVGTVRWVKVEPISFEIKNWDEMPRTINPRGNGIAKYFDLRSEEAITANIPFYPNEDDKNSTMWQNSMPRGFLNGINVKNITENGNPKFGAERGGNFTGECSFLNEAFNLEREPIYEYTIPKSETEIPDDAFNGCITLKKLVMHSGIKQIGKRAFEGLSFKYAYRLKSGELVFEQELPKNGQECEQIVELEKLVRPFVGFDYNLLVQNDKLKHIEELSQKLNKDKFSIPYVFADQLTSNGMTNSFCENSDFRFFRNEMPDINDELLDYPEEERLDFFKFAWSLGCFSTEKMLDKNGKETQIILAQKATTVLQTLLKTDDMKLGKYHGLFDSMPLGVKPSQEFLKFISEETIKKKKDEKGRTIPRETRLENLEMLIQLERRHPGMFIKVMTNFEDAKSYRLTLDETGKPVKLSWEDALKKFYLANKYVGVTNENADIAELFGGKGLSQQVFEKATGLRRQANQRSVPEHILGKPITEETILESIERIKSQTEAELTSGKQMIEDLYAKQFTYEWLSKNDPHNSIMGLFCSCCGTITSSFYGKDIAKASIIAPDVQNLVVRNSKGEIISKGTMYVNRERGYAIFNDFELNERYRHHEGSSGRYNVSVTSREEQERDMIFSAFQRGLKAFIEEYDKQNPQKPIQQVNVGLGYNRLKRQVEKFKAATSNLSVPTEYKFQDAASGQRILYVRDERKIKSGGDGR